MENNKEENKGLPCTITLEQAKNIYNSNVDPNIKDWVKTQYNDYQLGLTTIEEEFEKVFLDMLDYTKDNKKIAFLTQNNVEVNYPTNRFEIRNSKGLWLFNISYNLSNPQFVYSYHRIFRMIKYKFNLEYKEIINLMKTILEKHNICKNVTPSDLCSFFVPI